MVIAHDEFVARQRIQGVDQFLRLRNGKVPRVRHTSMLSLQQPLSRRLRKKREGLGQDERKGGGKQCVVHSDGCRRRVFLDAEHGTEASLGRRPVFHRFAAKEHPTCRQDVANRSSRQRTRSRFAVHEKREEFQQSGIGSAPALIETQPLRLIADQGRLQCLSQFDACIKRIREIGSGSGRLVPR